MAAILQLNLKLCIAGFSECPLQLSAGTAVMSAALCGHLCGLQEGVASQHGGHDPLLFWQVIEMSCLACFTANSF